MNEGGKGGSGRGRNVCGGEKIGKESRLSPVIRGGGIPVCRGGGWGRCGGVRDDRGSLIKRERGRENGKGETMFGIEREQTIICID